jgi:hypothetical protein
MNVSGTRAAHARDSIGKERCVPGSEFLFLLRQFIDGMKRVGSTDRDASSAIDTALGVNVELSHGLKPGVIFFGMNAVGRADVHAQKVFNAGVGDYISHDEVFLG